MKNLDYQKETYRGTIKQIMKVRGLRTISLSNYNKYLDSIGEDIANTQVHSLKIDIQDGYLNIYGFKGNARTGSIIADASAETYKVAFDTVSEILKNEKDIPAKVRKNILVKMSR